MNCVTHRAAFLAVCLLPAVWGCAATKPALAGAGGPSAVPRGVRHPVEAGQTLWRIAKAYGVPLDELARANGIDDPANLEVGRLLLIPGATKRIAVAPYPLPLALPEAEGSVAVATPELPLTWPVADGRILSDFGVMRDDHQHHGLDIGGRRDQPVHAALGGLVVFAGSTMRDYGKTVILDHGNGLSTLYAHGSTLLVREGQRVQRGQPIARIGRSGNARTEHCHFEVRRHDVPVDPSLYLNGGEARR